MRSRPSPIIAASISASLRTGKAIDSAASAWALASNEPRKNLPPPGAAFTRQPPKVKVDKRTLLASTRQEAGTAERSARGHCPELLPHPRLVPAGRAMLLL